MPLQQHDTISISFALIVGNNIFIKIFQLTRLLEGLGVNDDGGIAAESFLFGHMSPFVRMVFYSAASAYSPATTPTIFRRIHLEKTSQAKPSNQITRCKRFG